MFYWHGYPYTNFHELNLDWVMEKVSDNKNAITEIKNYLNSLSPDDPESPVAIESNILYISKDGRYGYSTITSAVDYAKGKIADGFEGRYLLIVLPGTYDEAVNLHPNPGIDIVAPVGATIRTTADYPYSPIYTAGRGTFYGLSLINLGNSYAMHFEANDVEANGNADFRNCSFQCSNNYAVGIGISGNSAINLYGCLAVSGGNKAALLLHNTYGEATARDVRFIDSSFYSASGIGMVFQDVSYPSLGEYGRAQCLIQISGCSTQKIRYYENTSFANGIGRLPITGKNIMLQASSSGNTNVAANYSNYTFKPIRATCRGDSLNGSFFIPLFFAPVDDWIFSISVEKSGVSITSQMTWQKIGNSIWLYGEPAKDANVDVVISISPGTNV